ncbi:HAD family hydrolase [Nocardioides bizhenqiangii]|uniref:Beta-phosphoglucomutase n=1 Tax=Nocardioides bizhenqiangii TaxID=3095076 RepID=A0ABZ0ZX98_9ACTN|nr:MULTISPECIES: beta-phosphoglucomutase family hydrolase [unclassified Nocardioides]MDZ5619469.1 beta-phosphoglucomutase family hydrolase [Nocardioides sp. HM23]WQQ28833.1 beta-phosphoglucomutase family hydrolase [Nocardioides sp. HM61]
MLPVAEVDWDQYDAALFDLDGVVTPTAEVHMRAWAAMFNDFLAGVQGQPPYTDQDYYDYVDGKPRYDGVRTFLLARGITLPEGDPSDPPEAETVAGLGNRKNEYFNRVLTEQGVQAYPGSVRLLDVLRERGLPMAIVSSSRNAPAVLDAAGVTDYFGTVMHGGVAAERRLAGKPAPDTFLAAAADLGATAERAVVLEDAISGVQAGAAGDFALVVGVDRGAGPAALTEAGADVVVADLAELLPDDQEEVVE